MVRAWLRGVLHQAEVCLTCRTGFHRPQRGRGRCPVTPDDEVGPLAVRAAQQLAPATVPMQRLQVAFVEERVVLATYRQEDGSSNERLLEPHALRIDWPAWYVIAHDRMRDEPRTFRLDRFGAIESGEERFRPRPRDLVERAVGVQGIVLDRV